MRLTLGTAGGHAALSSSFLRLLIGQYAKKAMPPWRRMRRWS